MASLRGQIPARLNLALSLLAGALGAFQLLAPALLKGTPGGMGWVLATSLLTGSVWALMHESLHGLLLPSPRWSARVGRALFVLHGVPFGFIRFGHLAHHRHNRMAMDRPEARGPGQHPLGCALRYYALLLGGLYWGQLLVGLLLLAPRPVRTRLVDWTFAADDPAVRQLKARFSELLLGRELRQVQRDEVLILLLYGGACWLYGDQWYVLALLLQAKGLYLSLHDNLYHYGTSLHSGRRAKNLALPRWAAALLLNFNLHGVHHAHPYLPWRELPRAAPVRGGHGAAGSGSGAAPEAEPYLPALWAQLRGPIPLADLDFPV